MALERDYQAKLIRRLKTMFPEPHGLVFKNDTAYLPGIPDITILYGNCWAMLEVKRKRPASPDDFEPNQEWYIEKLDRMSFSACIFPENEEEVLDDLQRAFAFSRAARLSER